jgi:hypothetical protein
MLTRSKRNQQNAKTLQKQIDELPAIDVYRITGPRSDDPRRGWTLKTSSLGTLIVTEEQAAKLAARLEMGRGETEIWSPVAYTQSTYSPKSDIWKMHRKAEEERDRELSLAIVKKALTGTKPLHPLSSMPFALHAAKTEGKQQKLVPAGCGSLTPIRELLVEASRMLDIPDVVSALICSRELHSIFMECSHWKTGVSILNELNTCHLVNVSAPCELEWEAGDSMPGQTQQQHAKYAECMQRVCQKRLKRWCWMFQNDPRRALSGSQPEHPYHMFCRLMPFHQSCVKNLLGYYDLLDGTDNAVGWSFEYDGDHDERSVRALSRLERDCPGRFHLLMNVATLCLAKEDLSQAGQGPYWYWTAFVSPANGGEFDPNTGSSFRNACSEEVMLDDHKAIGTDQQVREMLDSWRSNEIFGGLASSIDCLGQMNRNRQQLMALHSYELETPDEDEDVDEDVETSIAN